MKVYQHRGLWIVSSPEHYIGEYKELGEAMERAAYHSQARPDGAANS